MLKLLNKQTNIIFTLPDEEALQIVKDDRDSMFKILDAGFVEQTEEQVDEKTVKELVFQEETIEEETEEEDLTKFTNKELAVMCQKLGLTAKAMIQNKL